jgi:hypothetical protein
MPATSAVLRCAASTPSKNRSPPLADRSYVPARPLCPCPGNALPGACRNSRRQRSNTLGLTSNPRATSASETPASSRRTAASLNSLVNCLRDNPMTQFSIHWILSLNRLCQKWGQVQTYHYHYDASDRSRRFYHFYGQHRRGHSQSIGSNPIGNNHKRNAMPEWPCSVAGSGRGNRLYQGFGSTATVSPFGCDVVSKSRSRTRIPAPVIHPFYTYFGVFWRSTTACK